MTKKKLKASILWLSIVTIHACNLKAPQNKVFEGKIVLSEKESAEFKYDGEVYSEVDKEKYGGSSPSIQKLYHKPTKSYWIGKCSEMGIFFSDGYYKMKSPDSVQEYKEYLSFKLYDLFGVKTPEVVLSNQLVSKKATNYFLSEYIPRHLPSLREPRLHILSSFLDNYKNLGEDFLQSYCARSKDNYYTIENKQLQGFGKALAVATFLYDFDCLGGSGTNMGYVIEGNIAQVVKIDTGAALPFIEVISMPESVDNHDPRDDGRKCILAPFGKEDKGLRISFSDLNKNDQQEFVSTAKSILDCSDLQLKEVFKDVLKNDNRFKTVLAHLINRKANFLNAFSPEVRKLLEKEMNAIMENEAENLQANWNKPDSSDFKKGIVNNMKKKIELESYGSMIFFQLPESSETFIGRKKELKSIREILKEKKYVCIVGAGGFGKSSLATQYVHTAIKKGKYEKVLWLNTAYDLMLDQIQTYLHKAYGIQIGSVRQSELLDELFKNLNEKICIVLDNVENEKSIEIFLSKNQKTDVIITTRCKFGNIDTIALDIFSADETLVYLKKTLTPTIKIFQEDVLQLHKSLNGLPLAVSQAVSYVNQQKNMSLAEYNSLFKINQAETLKFSGSVSPSISATLTLAIHDIKRKNEQLDELMDIVAYLSPDNITKDLLEDFFNLKLIYSNLFNKGISINCTTIEKKVSLDNVVKLLLDYSIFIPNGIEKFKIHRLTQEVLRLIHKKNNLYEKNYLNLAECLIAIPRYNKQDPSYFDKTRNFVAQGTAIVGLFEGENPSWTKRYSIYSELGYQCLYILHDLSQAKIWYEKAKKTAETCYFPKVNETLPHLALIDRDMGNPEESKAILEKALKYSEENGSDVTSLAIAENLANTYGVLGQYKEQVEILENVLSIKEKHYGPKSIENAYTLINLGKAYVDLCVKIKDPSEPFFRIQIGGMDEMLQQVNALRALREITGSSDIMNHENLQTALNLGFLKTDPDYVQHLASEKRLALLYKALEIYEKNYGHQHPQVTTILSHLSDTYKDSGDYKKAKELLTKALKITEEVFGSNHINVATLLIDLSNLESCLGAKVEDRYKILLQALKIYVKSDYGPEHPNVAICLCNIAGCYLDMQKFRSSIVLYRIAYKALLNSYGSEHNDTKVCLRNVKLAEFKRDDAFADKSTNDDLEIFGRKDEEAKNNVEISSQSEDSSSQDNVSFVELPKEEIKIKDDPIINKVSSRIEEAPLRHANELEEKSFIKSTESLNESLVHNKAKRKKSCCCTIYTLHTIIYDNPLLNIPNGLKRAAILVGISQNDLLTYTTENLEYANYLVAILR